MFKIFVDGSSGTTGLRITDRLSLDKEIRLIVLPEAYRKDPEAKKEAMEAADVVFLCLPDDAAKEAVSLLDNDHTVIIDTSTAHRTDPSFAYGFPEAGQLKKKILSSKRIANPGCYASGFIALTAPLIENGLVKRDQLLTCFAVSGYSGGGKKMIAQYEEDGRDKLLLAPRQYGITQQHKHLPEMQVFSGLSNPPVFCPVVSDYYAGMEVTVPLFASQINGTVQKIRELYASYYHGKVVKYREHTDEGGFLSSNALEGRDDMEISVYGNDERILLVSRFDNLGKGASGAAIQNMNLVLGREETAGLVL